MALLLASGSIYTKPFFVPCFRFCGIGYRKDESELNNVTTLTKKVHQTSKVAMLCVDSAHRQTRPRLERSLPVSWLVA